jgi:hypothetical protein
VRRKIDQQGRQRLGQSVGIGFRLHLQHFRHTGQLCRRVRRGCDIVMAGDQRMDFTELGGCGDRAA